MEQLISQTAAYKILAGDKAADRLSHAYMLYFGDGANLRKALKRFALLFFREGGDRAARLIEAEAFADVKIYPKPDKKLTVDVAAEILDDAFLQPVEGHKKLYVISGLEEASALFQNKLLKILEEPPRGVYFLLGATSLAPILNTIKSRVKQLEIPPFSEDDILAALERGGANADNAHAAASCGGVLGVAENMLREKWYGEVRSAAKEICVCGSVPLAVRAAVKHGDCKYKNELLAEMQRIYFGELKAYADNPDYQGALCEGALIYAVEGVNRALADVKLNASFPSLLYDLLLRIAMENEKWLK